MLTALSPVTYTKLGPQVTSDLQEVAGRIDADQSGRYICSFL